MRRMFSIKKRAAKSTVGSSVELIIFATLGVAALTLLFTATTTTWGTVVPVIAITVVAVLYALSIALGFFGGHKGL